VDSLAKAKGLGNGFVYMNYAGKEQEVQQSYGNVSYARLQQEAAKWDPEGKLKSLWRGYFKL
jgi:hypothetical protein